MLDKDPNSWSLIFTPEVKAVIMSVIIAFLRIYYDDKENRWQRICLEAALCGAMSYCISAGLTYFNLPQGVSVFFGGLVGFLGVDFIRAKAKQAVTKRVDKL